MKNLNIEPRKVFDIFQKISEIPRGSGNEKAVSDFAADFARERGAEVVQDNRHNVIIKKAAAAGVGGGADSAGGASSSGNAVILQAHLDMVCEKNEGTAHDFLRDGIDIFVDGDWLKARGTTLGADNGIGVAMCLALLDGDYAHPPLEILLTTEEETGMDGAKKLDVSQLRGRRMLNLDSSDEGKFTVGCAAGTVTEFFIPAERTGVFGAACEVAVKGLKGGHSGGDIEKERGNALRILAHILEETATNIIEIHGGMKVNAIPREASARFVFGADREEITAKLENFRKNFADRFRATDAGLSIEWRFFEAETEAFTAECTKKIIAALLLIPNGVISLSTEIEGLTNSSCNIGVCETTADGVEIQAMPRGAARYYNDHTEGQISALAGLLGARVSFTHRSPAWPYNPDSALLRTAKEAYKSASGGGEATATAVHGGLECGIFSEKIAGLEIISFGPEAHDYHTPDERVSISSTARTWEFLLELLKVLSQEEADAR